MSNSERAWLAKIRMRQLEMGKKITNNLWFIFVALNKQYSTAQIDAGAKDDFETEVLSAVYGYTDWAAARLIKSSFKIPAFERPTAHDIEDISKIYGVNVVVTMHAITWMLVSEEIPLLGSIAKGSLVPDTENLLRWAALTEWGRQL